MLVVIKSDLVLGGLVGVGGSDNLEHNILLLSIMPYKMTDVKKLCASV